MSADQNTIPSHSNPPKPPMPKERAVLGIFGLEQNDHELKIAILNFLSANSENLLPFSQIIPIDRIEKGKPVFEQIFYYIKNLPDNREVSIIPESTP